MSAGTFGLMCPTLDALESGVIVIDAQARIVVWNRWMVRHSDIAAQAALGRTLADSFPSITGTRIAAALELCLSHRMPAVLSPLLHRSILPLFRNPDERQRQSVMRQQITISPLAATPDCASPPDALGCIVQIRDETNSILREDKLRAQHLELSIQNAALQASEKNLRQLIAEFPDAIGVHREGKLVYTNAALSRLFGAGSAEELIGTPIAKLIHPDSQRVARSRIKKIIDAGRVAPLLEERYRRLDGSEFLAEVQGQQINFEGQVAALSVLRDITERKVAEAELAQHRQHLEELVRTRTADLSLALAAAEAASGAKTRFLANMSHELRTPIHGMMGMTDLALRAATNDKQVGWLHKSKVSAEHLLAIINDILDMSKIEAGRLTLDETDFSLAATVTEILHMHEAPAKSKGLSLAAQIAPALPAFLRGDELRLKQVLINFVGNAIKFSEQGQITIRARAVSEDSAGVLLRLEVVDQGIGLSADQQARLFHAFTQVDDSMTRKVGGTGLGLAIAKHLAQLMGGEVGVISEPGRGSTFWATARVARGNAVVSPAIAAISASTREMLLFECGGARVLVVEDEPFNQEVAQCMLEDAGLIVDLASNGREALERVRDGDYALILMDMQMPVMNGLDATRAIRALPGLATLPIVAMTANAFSEDRDKCLAAGMNDFVSKPVAAEVLYEKVLRWLT